MMTAKTPGRPLLVAAPLSILGPVLLLAACGVIAPDPAMGPRQQALAVGPIAGTLGMEAVRSPGGEPVEGTPRLQSRAEPFGSTVAGSGVAATAIDGSVRGIVFDEQTAQPIANAQVYLAGMGIGGLSSTDGSYALSSVPAGTYDIVVVYPGYLAGRRPGVSVADGTTIEVK